MDPMIKEKNEHLLSLKVMCLTRPSFIAPTIVTADNKDWPGLFFNDLLKKDITTVPGSETIAVSSFLLLPQCFKDIYLGETFSCFVCVHNHSNVIAKDVELRVYLETPSTKVNVIRDPKHSTDLPPGGNVDEVIRREVTEIGNHLLTCEVNYTATSERSFKKMFKFEVHKPLEIKTNLYPIKPQETYLQAEVQNITSSYMVLDNVSLEAPPIFRVEKLCTTQKIDSLQLNILDSQESKHFLYSVTLESDKNNRNLRAMTEKGIGKLDIVWRSNLGERGHLQTLPLLKRTSDLKDLQIFIDELPSQVYLEEMFSIKLRLINITEGTMSPMLLLEPIGGLAWCATSGVSIGELTAYESKTITLNVIPLIPGLQTITGIKIKDSSSNKNYDFKEETQVYVIKKST